MEELHCIGHSTGGWARVISLPALPPPASFARLVAGWLGLRRSSPSYQRKHSFIEDAPCPLDVDYPGSVALAPGTESYLDRKFGRWDFVISDPGPVTVSWDSVFDDSTTISQTHGEQGLLLHLDLALENTEFAPALFSNLSQPGSQAWSARFIAFALAAHLAAFSLFFAAPASSLRGHGGISDKPISVRLMETCEISTPDDPSPGSVVSLASMASLARRHPKPEETRMRRETESVLPTEVEPKDMTREAVTEPRPVDAKRPTEPVRVHSREPLEHSPDGSPNDSKSFQDSIASMPSVASPERQGPSKSGDEVQTYKDLILSAIHDAAYYPRAALRNMAHGRTVVSFTIKKDGSLSDIAIVSHAHSKVLDEAALKIVEKASSHFPPLPESIMKEQVCYVVPIVFKKGL
jgi:TonB family protein